MCVGASVYQVRWALKYWPSAVECPLVSLPLPTPKAHSQTPLRHRQSFLAYRALTPDHSKTVTWMTRRAWGARAERAASPTRRVILILRSTSRTYQVCRFISFCAPLIYNSIRLNWLRRATEVMYISWRF